MLLAPSHAKGILGSGGGLSFFATGQWYKRSKSFKQVERNVISLLLIENLIVAENQTQYII